MSIEEAIKRKIFVSDEEGNPYSRSQYQEERVDRTEADRAGRDYEGEQ